VSGRNPSSFLHLPHLLFLTHLLSCSCSSITVIISIKKLEELCDAKNIRVKDLEEEMQQVAKESDPFTFQTME
jgi:hypothetical protein